MSEKNHGGPAFPLLVPNESGGDIIGFNGETIPDGFTTAYQGLGARDYFAAKAMQAMIANDRLVSRIERDPRNSGLTLGECVAFEAYALADNMISERAK